MTMNHIGYNKIKKYIVYPRGDICCLIILF